MNRHGELFRSFTTPVFRGSLLPTTAVCRINVAAGCRKDFRIPFVAPNGLIQQKSSKSSRFGTVVLAPFQHLAVFEFHSVSFLRLPDDGPSALLQLGFITELVVGVDFSLEPVQSRARLVTLTPDGLCGCLGYVFMFSGQGYLGVEIPSAYGNTSGTIRSPVLFYLPPGESR